MTDLPGDRVVLIVLDSCGCGAAPDAARYGDAGANTLGNLSVAMGGLTLPHLLRMGLGHLTTLLGVPPVAAPRAAYGTMCPASVGKDTTTGHWEMAGLRLDTGFPTFPHGFPAELMARFEAAIGRGTLGNRTASGTTILEELGAEHLATGKPIVYTSADSVFQVAAHEAVIPVSELYRICAIARDLVDALPVARVIARPFVGAPGHFQRTYQRRDFSMPPPAPTVLESLVAAGLAVVGIGKIPDIYAGRGITEAVHTAGNADGCQKTLAALGRVERGLIFTNLVDFDMLYGHRRDPAGYYRALQEFDAFLPALEAALGPGDLCLITADHGNDPTFAGTDHTREEVPLLAFGPGVVPGDLGRRDGFFDLAATLAERFGLSPWPRGRSFAGALAGR